MTKDKNILNKEAEKLRIERNTEASKVTWLGFWVNMLLSVGKILAGIFGRSGAMLADGIHSLSDFITDVIVLVFMKISSKNTDQTHDYGHGKFETFATFIISVALFAVAILLMISGAKKIIASLMGNVIDKPGYIALIAAAVSIISKEWLFRKTRAVGEKINSQAVIANGWHHRSDAFSSVGTLIGISGAIFLGAQWRILDPIASIIVSVFIIGVAIKLLRPAVEELTDASLSDSVEEEIASIVKSVEGVDGMHNMKTRKSGNGYIIDVHIKVDPNMTVIKAHDEIASKIEDLLREKFGPQTQTSIHVEPKRY
ncbi:MAG: cation diffusion facilitator family transporter [Bacteroidales bacterium]|nr:cation diffusion facilitator family transporter [Bacteroidales bacterium]MDD4420175.1 cation diffusion facilitator family transporter [Bacteroidales bacterium]